MVLLICSLVLIAAAFAQSAPTVDPPGGPYKSEKDLRRDLFQDYDKNARPVLKASTSVPVKISMTPLSLTSMKEKEQMITLDTWIMMTWTDEYLQWDPEEYENISVLHVSPADIWRPDIAVYTASPDTYLYPKVLTQTLVYNNGMVLWVPPFTINSRCPIPFRSYVSSARSFVECNIRLGSWTYNGKMMDIQLSTDKVDLTNFQDYNPEWKLVKIDSNRESKLYPCCPDEYPLVNFNVTLKRRNYYLNTGSEN